MTSFNEWLEQRDERIYKEMFDEPTDLYKNDLNPATKDFHSGGELFKVSRDGKIVLTTRGFDFLRKMAGSPILPHDMMEKFGNELIAHMQFFDEMIDVDLSAVRKALVDILPQAELAFDAVVKRFAQRVNRRVGGGGNLLFTAKSAQRGLRTDINKLNAYKTGIPIRDAEEEKIDRLKGYRSLGFGS